MTPHEVADLQVALRQAGGGALVMQAGIAEPAPTHYSGEAVNLRGEAVSVERALYLRTAGERAEAWRRGVGR